MCKWMRGRRCMSHVHTCLGVPELKLHIFLPIHHEGWMLQILVAASRTCRFGFCDFEISRERGSGTHLWFFPTACSKAVSNENKDERSSKAHSCPGIRPIESVQQGKKWNSMGPWHVLQLSSMWFHGSQNLTLAFFPYYSSCSLVYTDWDMETHIINLELWFSQYIYKIWMDWDLGRILSIP